MNTQNLLQVPQEYSEEALKKWENELRGVKHYHFDTFYSPFARSTAVYQRMGNNLSYPFIGLLGELAELDFETEQYFENSTDENKEKVEDELGDVLWYLNNLLFEINSIKAETSKKYSLHAFLSGLHYYNLNFNYYHSFSKVAGIIKKIDRGDYTKLNHMVESELMNNLSVIMYDCHVRLIPDFMSDFVNDQMDFYKHCAIKNMVKLQSRKLRNVIRGDGGNR